MEACMFARSIRLVLSAMLLTVVTVSTTQATNNDPVSYRVEKAEVVIVCPLTVGGSFEAKTNAMSGEIAQRPGDPISGSLQVNLETLDTGIGLRDRHMKEKYLEVQKGPEYAVATLEDIRVERLDGKTALKGILQLHGQRREVSGTADIKQEDGRVRVQAQFPVRVSDFQIPKPTYLGVGVRDEITVKVSMTVSPTTTTLARK
jgi:polyisoprenoid-binding protein YceI